MLLLMLWVIPIGCQTDNAMVRFVRSDNRFHGGEYEPALKKWTRKDRIYTGLALELIVVATFKSALYRQAFTDEYARLYRMDAATKKEMLHKQLKEAKEYHEFFIAAYTPEKNTNDVDEPDSVWKVFLVDDQNRSVEPSLREKLDKSDAKYQYFFPYITVWKSIYRLRFPVTSNHIGTKAADGMTPHVKLVITGVLGTSEMEWLPANTN